MLENTTVLRSTYESLAYFTLHALGDDEEARPKDKKAETLDKTDAVLGGVGRLLNVMKTIEVDDVEELVSKLYSIDNSFGISVPERDRDGIEEFKKVMAVVKGSTNVTTGMFLSYDTEALISKVIDLDTAIEGFSALFERMIHSFNVKDTSGDDDMVPVLHSIAMQTKATLFHDEEPGDSFHAAAYIVNSQMVPSLALKAHSNTPTEAVMMAVPNLSPDIIAQVTMMLIPHYSGGVTNRTIASRVDKVSKNSGDESKTIPMSQVEHGLSVYLNDGKLSHYEAEKANDILGLLALACFCVRYAATNGKMTTGLANDDSALSILRMTSRITRDYIGSHEDDWEELSIPAPVKKK